MGAQGASSAGKSQTAKDILVKDVVVPSFKLERLVIAMQLADVTVLCMVLTQAIQARVRARLEVVWIPMVTAQQEYRCEAIGTTPPKRMTIHGKVTAVTRRIWPVGSARAA